MSRRLYFLIPLIFLFAGCAVPAPKLTIPKEVDLKTVSWSEKSEILKNLASKAEGVSGFRGMYHGQAEVHGKKMGFKQILVFERPENLRMEILLTNINRLSLIVLNNPKGLFGADLINRNVYHGKNSVDNLNCLLGLPLGTEEFMLWATGNLPVVADPNFFTLSKIKKSQLGDQIEVSYQNSSDTHRNYYLINNRLDFYEMINAQGEIVFLTHFFYEPGAPENSLPSSIKLELPKQKLNIELNLIEFDLNPNFDELRDLIFQHQKTTGYQVLNLDEVNDCSGTLLEGVFGK